MEENALVCLMTFYSVKEIVLRVEGFCLGFLDVFNLGSS